MQNAIIDVPGIRVGHYTNLEAATGCTVVLCEEGAVGGVDVRGGAPGTRETELLQPMRLVERVHALLLTGGSAFGLAAADGVMRYLEERGYGYPMGPIKVPIVPAAVLFDLGLGDPKVRPDAEAGYQTCLAASSDPLEEGSVGVGTGATVGKLLGIGQATKGGLGTASESLGQGMIIGAIVGVNALGDVIDLRTREILAGARHPETGEFIDTLASMKRGLGGGATPLTNTTIGVVATNAPLTVEGANKIAQMAQDGLAMSIRPAHTMFDGDTIFAISVSREEKMAVDISLLGAVAAEVVAKAVVRAVTRAKGLLGVPACKELAGR